MGSCSSGLRRAMRNSDLEDMERILEDAGVGAPDLINEDTTADCCLDWLEACCHGNHSPLHTAVMKQHVAMTTLLLKYGADVTGSNRHGNTALHVASGCNRVDLCELLIKYGADVNARNGQGETPAFHAIISMTCRLSNSTAALNYLRKQPGFDLNCTDINGNTLLHVAASTDNVQACEVLVQSIDKSVTNNYNKTPEQVAKQNCKLVLI